MPIIQFTLGDFCNYDDNHDGWDHDSGFTDSGVLEVQSEKSWITYIGQIVPTENSKTNTTIGQSFFNRNEKVTFNLKPLNTTSPMIICTDMAEGVSDTIQIKYKDQIYNEEITSTEPEKMEAGLSSTLNTVTDEIYFSSSGNKIYPLVDKNNQPINFKSITHGKDERDFYGVKCYLTDERDNKITTQEKLIFDIYYTSNNPDPSSLSATKLNLPTRSEIISNNNIYLVIMTIENNLSKDEIIRYLYIYPRKCDIEIYKKFSKIKLIQYGRIKIYTKYADSLKGNDLPEIKIGVNEKTIIANNDNEYYAEDSIDNIPGNVYNLSIENSNDYSFSHWTRTDTNEIIKDKSTSITIKDKLSKSEIGFIATLNKVRDLEIEYNVNGTILQSCWINFYQVTSSGERLLETIMCTRENDSTIIKRLSINENYVLEVKIPHENESVTNKSNYYNIESGGLIDLDYNIDCNFSGKYDVKLKDEGINKIRIDFTMIISSIKIEVVDSDQEYLGNWIAITTPEDEVLGEFYDNKESSLTIQVVNNQLYNIVVQSSNNIEISKDNINYSKFEDFNSTNISAYSNTTYYIKFSLNTNKIPSAKPFTISAQYLPGIDGIYWRAVTYPNTISEAYPNNKFSIKSKNEVNEYDYIQNVMTFVKSSKYYEIGSVSKLPTSTGYLKVINEVGKGDDPTNLVVSPPEFKGSGSINPILLTFYVKIINNTGSDITIANPSQSTSINIKNSQSGYIPVSYKNGYYPTNISNTWNVKLASDYTKTIIYESHSCFLLEKSGVVYTKSYINSSLNNIFTLPAIHPDFTNMHYNIPLGSSDIDIPSIRFYYLPSELGKKQTYIIDLLFKEPRVLGEEGYIEYNNRKFYFNFVYNYDNPGYNLPDYFTMRLMTDFETGSLPVSPSSSTNFKIYLLDGLISRPFQITKVINNNNSGAAPNTDNSSFYNAIVISIALP
ncbi:MAG: hypothetical protein J1F35_03665 [Erysipelotrichales bacterium]|nr:hypothetical protein [Erysipelotrichales bacterium]